MEEEKSYQDIIDDFTEKYKTTLLPKLVQLKLDINEKKYTVSERDEEKYKIKNRIAGIVILGLFIFQFSATFVLVEIIRPKDPPVLFFLMWFAIFFAIPAISFWASAKEKNVDFYGEIKKFILPEVCKCFPSLMWTPDKKPNYSIYKEAGLPISEKHDDSFIGNHKKVNFIIDEFICPNSKNYTDSSAKLQGHSDPNLCLLNTTKILLQFKINKSFKGHTLICPSGMKNNIRNLHITELEDVVFEKTFDVYTNDDVEARYLITANFMKKLNNIINKYNSDETYVSFYQGTLYILMHSPENLFEIRSIVHYTDVTNYLKWVLQLISIYKLIDYFKLDQNIKM